MSYRVVSYLVMSVSHAVRVSDSPSQLVPRFTTESLKILARPPRAHSTYVARFYPRLGGLKRFDGLSRHDDGATALPAWKSRSYRNGGDDVLAVAGGGGRGG